MNTKSIIKFFRYITIFISGVFLGVYMAVVMYILTTSQINPEPVEMIWPVLIG
jgi:hypothetical protein